MIIYPALDLINGQCVRLEKGDFSAKTVYQKDPFLQAQTFKNQGAQWLHIVDLDGAKKGSPQQAQLIVDIATKVGIKVQTGGGLRRETDIKSLLASGINRVVIGSLAVKMLALDVVLKGNQAYIATNGWQKTSSLLLDDAITQFNDMGSKHFLITDISRDGLLTGPNIGLYKDLQNKFPNLKIQVSGGMSSLTDLENLKAINAKGVIIGKALYENKFTLAEAFKIVGNNDAL